MPIAVAAAVDENEFLTFEEQKKFRKLLDVAKRQSGDPKFLEQQALNIRKEIINARKSENDTLSGPVKQLRLPQVFPIIQNPQMAGLSNWLAKTSIFAPRPLGGQRNDTGSEYVELESPKGITIYFNGTELDMADQTLYLNLLKLAEGRGPNESIFVNRAQLLKLCGFTKLGSSSYQWLNNAFERLAQAHLKLVVENVEISDEDDFSKNEVSEFKGKKVKRVIFRLQMMGNLAEDETTGDYYFTMPRESLTLFANQMFGHNDLIKRIAIQKGRGGALAAWLQSYICSDGKGEHMPVLVETLKQRSASKSRTSDFFTRLKRALDICKAQEIITSWRAYKNERKQWLVQWTR